MLPDRIFIAAGAAVPASTDPAMCVWPQRRVSGSDVLFLIAQFAIGRISHTSIGLALSKQALLARTLTPISLV